MKDCIRCKNNYPIKCFYRIRKNSIYRRNVCKYCFKKYRENNIKKYRKNWNKASKKYYRNNPLNRKLKKYGLTKEGFLSIIKNQKGKCKICGEQLPLSVDHCHKTGKVRGLLCRECNMALGMVNDSKKILKKMIGYLTSSPDLRNII